MDQRKLEANIRSAGQEISCILWNLKLHCLLHKSVPSSKLDKFHQQIPIYLFNTCFNIVHPSMTRSYQLSLPFMFSNYAFLPLLISSCVPVYSLLFDHTINIT
jgi:hypothetical protein